MNIIPETKYLHFILCPEGMFRRGGEASFCSYGWQHCRNLAQVAKKALENYDANAQKNWGGRIACYFSTITGPDTVEKTKQFHWTFKLDSTGYYKLKNLVWEDDFTEYVRGTRKFDDIRTAKDFVKEPLRGDNL